jgi:hypothetical protein
MVQRVNAPEVMTAREAMRKYATHYIGFVVIEQNLRNPDFEKGYILFLSDTYNEGLYECSDMDLNVGVLRGYDVDEPVEVGGLEVVWK